MTINQQAFYTILILSTLATLAIRVVPFIVVKLIRFPKWLAVFLHYLPLTMMTALFVQNVFDKKADQLLPLMNIENVLALIPALIIGYLRNSLLVVVVVGIVCMAGLRFFNGV